MTRIFLLPMMAVLGTTLAGTAVAGDSAAQAAFELRVSGQLDQAQTLLEQSLAKKPNDAAAHYELARTQMHRALGNPKNMEQSFAGAQQSIAQAVAIDPQRVVYHTFAGHVAYFQAYLALQLGKPNLNERFTAAIDAFQAALQVKPDDPHVKLYLIELHAQFPEDVGADRSKAKMLAEQLATQGDLYAAKAASIVSPESCDLEFWQALNAKHKSEDADVLEELGKAHLRNDQVSAAERIFQQAIERDPSKTYLLLDLSIYHTFRRLRARRSDPQQFQQSLAAGDAAVTRYLNSNPNRPMQAYALGVQSKYKSAAGARDQARELIARATSLDPFFSKATGAPSPDLFVAPGEIVTQHRYLMRPY